MVEVGGILEAGCRWEVWHFVFFWGGGGWSTRLVNGSYGASLWKYIRNGWEKFSHFVKFELEDDTRISFWSS